MIIIISSMIIVAIIIIIIETPIVCPLLYFLAASCILSTMNAYK